jgi:glycosyltransferase involved in cell wall biosynthesis
MTPRVSILLPTHHRPDVLGYSIQSILTQTDSDFELLIVGDGCTDETREVVARFSDPRIRWFDLPKAPLSGYANRNIVLKQTTSRYVAYAQDDDIMFPDHVAKLIATIEESGADWAYSRPVWCAPDGFVLPLSLNLRNEDEFTHFLTTENYIPSSFVMHKRDALERVGFWPEDVERMSDWVCWRRIIETSTSGAAAYCSQSTSLHFRARWRQRDNPPVMRLAEIARGAGWWPSSCKLAIPSGTVEQKVFFEAMRAAPDAWVDRIRSGVAQINERLAWGAVALAAQTWPPDSAVLCKHERFLKRWATRLLPSPLFQWLKERRRAALSS